jgi:hypothetical protein
MRATASGDAWLSAGRVSRASASALSTRIRATLGEVVDQCVPRPLARIPLQVERSVGTRKPATRGDERDEPEPKRQLTGVLALESHTPNVAQLRCSRVLAAVHMFPMPAGSDHRM